MDFFGTPLVVEPSAAQLCGDAGMLPVRQFSPHIGLRRAYIEAGNGPRATGLTEPRLRERAPHVVGIFAASQDRDGHGNRLDS
jgi:hypothetical protein